MGCKNFTTTIQGHDYGYTQLSAKKSMKLKFKLFGLLGGAVSDIMPAVGAEEDVQLEAFGKALQDIFSKNDPDKIVALIEDVCVPAFRDGERINIDKHYTGNTEELYEALFWILKCEYENFFVGLQGMLQAKGPMKAK